MSSTLEKFGSATGIVFGRLYRTLLFVIAYSVTSFLIFGNLHRPIFFVLSLGMDAGVPLPGWIVWGSIIIGFAAAYAAAEFIKQKEKFLPIKLPVAAVFVTVLMGVSALTAGALATALRYKAINTLNADKVSVRSFQKSLRTDPGHQTFPHAVAIKDCEPFIWSYTTMSFHPLKPNASKSVLPQSWIDGCENL